jgi:thiamine kinase-like enzyme
MNNIINVTNYVSNKLSTSNLVVLSFNTTEEGKPYVVDELGNFWRARQYLDCITFDTTDNLQIIEEAGSAFGEFQFLLDGFDASTLFESIPNFHNTRKRIENLERAIAYSKGDRKSICFEEIGYILANKVLACKLCDMLDANELPLRVTHNDTKCNNVIFSKKTNKALAVIDLDTIMPGLTAYDFGDGARSIASTTEEDEADLTKVKLDLDKFERFTKGYLKNLKNSLTQNEIESLGISVYIMTLELASRFLEDYLNGDVYFRTHYGEQNLRRTRCQIALCKDIYKKLDRINEIINKYI